MGKETTLRPFVEPEAHTNWRKTRWWAWKILIFVVSYVVGLCILCYASTTYNALSTAFHVSPRPGSVVYPLDDDPERVWDTVSAIAYILILRNSHAYSCGSGADEHAREVALGLVL